MSFTLYGYERNPRTRVVRIVAAAEGILLNNVEVIPRQGIGKENYVTKFPLSMGKIPGLESPDGLRLTETLAITSYLASLHNKSKLLGDGSESQAAEVLSWMSWANQELLPTLALWFLPLIPFSQSPVVSIPSSVAAGKASSLALLSTLESHLDGRTYLVGTYLTLADIMVAMYVSRGLEWVLGREWREGHARVMNHFQTVAAWECVSAIVPSFKMVEEEG